MMTIKPAHLTRRNPSRHAAPIFVAFAMVLSLVPAPVAAQTPTVHIQGALIGKAAGTVGLGLQLTKPLGDVELPKPGQVSTTETQPWLLIAGAGGGYSWARKEGRTDGFNATAELGVVRRTGALIDQVGLVAYLNTKPLGAGPAVRAKVLIIDIKAGGMWLEKGQGFRWFVGGGVSLEFLLDLFKR
jgi:hypothetical protein